MKIQTIIIAMLLISTIFVLAEDSDKEETPVEKMIGDWIITGDITVKNRMLLLQGNLYIEGGALRLINSTLIMDLYAQGQFGIFVENGLMALCNSTITANNTKNHYFMVVKESSTFSALNSTVEYAGYKDGERSGLYLRGNLKLNNTIFRYNYYPIWAYRIKNTRIANITIYQNQYGLKFVECENLTIENLNISRNYRTGIWMKRGEGNVIEGCNIETIYIPSGSTLANGIIIENESHDIVRNNTIGKTKKEAIMVKGELCWENIIENNTIYRSGNAGIHLYKTHNTLIYKNNFSSIGRGILTEIAENSTFKEDVFSSNVGMALYNSKDTRIVGERMEKVKTYGIMVYSSNTTNIYGLNVINCTYVLYVKNSVVLFSGHLYPDKYFVSGKSRLYFAIWVKVSVYDYLGKPMKGVRLKLRFLGETISETVTYGAGISSFYAPYALQTHEKKSYSWCEIVADRNISFEENPIRFYSWDKREIIFRERPPGLEVSIFTDKKEATPGERVNITIVVKNRTGFVNNASVDISLNGKPGTPPSPVGNGTYIVSINLPDFNTSLRIVASATVENQTGNASISIMRPSVPYNGSFPMNTRSQSSFYLWFVSGLGISVLLLALVILRRKRRRGFENYRPLSPEKVEVER